MSTNIEKINFTPNVLKDLDEKVLSSIKETAQHPRFDTYEKRLETFDFWPIEYFLPKKTVAQAGFGFFHVDKSTDKIACYSCAGEITSTLR